MAERDSEKVLRDRQISDSSVSKAVSPPEKIDPAASTELTAHKNIESIENGSRQGNNIDERVLRLEASHSSFEGGSDEVRSQKRRFSTKYRISFHLSIWLVMTGQVLIWNFWRELEY
jgi:hypothetical protein